MSVVDWSPGRVAAAVRHPLSLRLYAEAPYVPELFHDDLESRITHPAEAGQGNMSPAIRVHRGSRVWYLLGSAANLLLHTSCVTACYPAILRYLPAHSDDYDFGPPLVSEMLHGSWGQHRMVQSYWARLERALDRHLANGYTHVARGDIARCGESLEPERLSSLLKEANADEDGVRVLDQMHRSWQQAGSRGLPHTGVGFRVLLKLYLREVDGRLRREGLTFVRLQDDFRFLCRAESEARAALDALSAALTDTGLSLNPDKTQIVSMKEVPGSWRWRSLSLKRIFSEGIGQPALSDALQSPVLRPLALRLLGRLYGHRCRSK